VQKEELEAFVESLKVDYQRLKKEEMTKIGFQKFKECFCDDRLLLEEKCTKISDLKVIYNKISSDGSSFFVKIRKFIIEKFAEQIKFCPYCWKTPLIYFERWKDKNNSYHRLFQFDHFFPKNVYHKWIINFYNLIPSCNACNHLKHDDNPLDIIKRGWVLFHPYFWNLYLDNWELKYDWARNADIRLNYLSENSKFFKLGQKYLNDDETFNTFQFIQDKRTKMKDERTKFKVNCKSDEQLIDYFFKNYAPQTEQEILKYSNGKLKKDLIENLKM